jgi:hypothetical protein
VNATAIKELVDKIENIEIKIGQQMWGSSTFSPNYRSSDGYGTLIHERFENRLGM